MTPISTSMLVAPLMTWLFVITRPDFEMTTPEPAVWLPLDSVAAMLTIAGLTDVATLRTLMSVEVVALDEPELSNDPLPDGAVLGGDSRARALEPSPDGRERSVTAIPTAVPASSASVATATRAPTMRRRAAWPAGGAAGHGATGGGPTGGGGGA